VFGGGESGYLLARRGDVGGRRGGGGCGDMAARGGMGGESEGV